jgi:hypothetical protein
MRRTAKDISVFTDNRWNWRSRLIITAVNGSNGAGRPLAQRLLADGEHVGDVPPKLSARARCSTRAAPTTGARSPPARPGWKPCAA